MWAVSACLFAFAKALSLEPLGGHVKWSARRLTGYLLLWPGMDARAFTHNRIAPTPSRSEWVWALAKTLLGLSLLWASVRWVEQGQPLLVGWLAMVAIAFALHFGVFHLLALAWRQAGVDARPIMAAPLAATSVGRFWGRHWNRAFADLMQPLCFAPLARRMGPAPAVCAVFFLSGLLHELVISLPARGGYGLPTIYFAAQAAGVLLERGKLGQRLGLGAGTRGWLFTMLVAAGPAFWLFHPLFVQTVILPMLRAFGQQ